MKLDEIVEVIYDHIDYFEGDCSICPFGNMTEDGMLHCDYIKWCDEDEIVCDLDTKEKIKQEVIKAVKESEIENGK